MNRSFLILLVLVIFLGAGFGGSFVGGIIYGQSLEGETENEFSPRLGTTGQLTGGGQGVGASQRGQGRRGQGGGPESSQGGLGDAGSVESSGPGDGQQSSALELPERTGATREGQAGRNPGREVRNQTDGTETSQIETAADTENAAAGPSGAESMPSPPSGNSRPETGGRPSSGRGGLVGSVMGLGGDVLTVESLRGELSVTLAETTNIYEVRVASRDSLLEGATVRVNGSRDSGGGVTAQTVIVLPEGAETLFGTGGPGGRQRGGGP